MSELRQDDLAEELVERCAKLLAGGDWDRIYSALGELHDQLRDDIPDDEEFCALFPVFIARLIQRLRSPQIHALSQAQVYANSADTAHRAQAGVWIKHHYRQP